MVIYSAIYDINHFNFKVLENIKKLIHSKSPRKPPHPPALPKDASTLSAEANEECHDTNKDLSEKYLVFRRFNCSLAKQYLWTHRKSQFVTKKYNIWTSSESNFEKQIIIFDMILSKIKIFLKIAFFSVVYCKCTRNTVTGRGHYFNRLRPSPLSIIAGYSQTKPCQLNFSWQSLAKV